MRDFTKWDDQPASAAAAVESLFRGYQIATTSPRGPVYVNCEVDWQEAPLEAPLELPDPARHVAGEAPAAGAETIRLAAEALEKAKAPLLLFGRGGRDARSWANRIALAERLGARVLTDLKTGAVFPTTHPLHGAAPGFIPGADALTAIRKADVIASFDWIDLGGVLSTAWKGATSDATIINCTLDSHLHRGWSFDYHVLPPADVRAMADPDAFVAQLLDALGPGSGGAFDRVVSPNMPHRTGANLRSPTSRASWTRFCRARRAVCCACRWAGPPPDTGSKARWITSASTVAAAWDRAPAWPWVRRWPWPKPTPTAFRWPSWGMAIS